MIALVAALMLAVIPPAPTQYVTDNAHALSPGTQARLEARLHDFDKKSGDQIIVWIGETTGEQSLEQFTVDAAQKWRVGKKGKDNGAALFLFMRDRKVRIEVGYGLEGVLTDARSSQIIRDNVVPLMKKGETDSAVEAGVNAMISTIDPSAAPSASPSPQSGGDDTGAAIAMLIVFIIVFGGLIFAAIVTIRRRGKPHGDWMDAWMFGTAAQAAGGGSSHWYGGGSGGGGFSGFSGGGGSFGGGGASGGW